MATVNDSDSVAGHPRVDVMPYEPSLPCSVCRRSVDPLRTRAVAVLDSGFRYFCGQLCLDKFRVSEPSRRMPVMPASVPGLGDRW
jgi:YHS domain-containing protein